jgi:hypothetical protein
MTEPSDAIKVLADALSELEDVEKLAGLEAEFEDEPGPMSAITIHLNSLRARLDHLGGLLS